MKEEIDFKWFIKLLKQLVFGPCKKSNIEHKVSSEVEMTLSSFSVIETLTFTGKQKFLLSSVNKQRISN